MLVSESLLTTDLIFYHPCLVCFALATITFLLLLDNAKHIPTSGPLHVLFSLPIASPVSLFLPHHVCL